MAGSVQKVKLGSNGAKHVDAKTGTPIKFTSPTSESSGDTLHEDGSSGIRSQREGTDSLSSPFSPESLDFDDLSIGGASHPKPTGVGRYTAPFQRGVRNYNDSTTPDLARRGDSFRTGSPFSGGRGGGGNFRNSRTWMSADAQAMQEFMVIRNAMRRQFKSSEVAKWKYNDYIAHREAMLASQANLLANKVKAKEDALRIPPIPFDTQQNLNKWGLYGNFNEVTNLSRVLGEHTIWCRDWKNGKDDIAPWPSIAELKWEGDDRAKTGVGRYPPLPREQGPPGLPWNQLPCVDQYPMDQVARIPTMEDVYLPVDDQIEEEKQYLWSQDLEEAMDAFLDS